MEQLHSEGELVVEDKQILRKVRPKDGAIRNNLWEDIGETKSTERTGSPTRNHWPSTRESSWLPATLVT